jgi:hypothetical protein
MITLAKDAITVDPLGDLIHVMEAESEGRRS